MTSTIKRRIAASRGARAQSGLHLALRCAERVFAAVDRRMPEGGALASWLAQSAVAFGLADADLPDDGLYGRSRGRRGVPAQDWRRVGAAIAAALEGIGPEAATPASAWLEAVGRKLPLDALERDILSVALHYRLDQRVERLFDALSEARGSEARLHRDPELLGLLLGEDASAIEARMQPGAKLLSGGVLRVERDGELGVLSQLVTLIRSATLPQPDFYDQLLGATLAEPLPWTAFAHLGREADIAAALLRAALAGREVGVNVLLYGPPGTGKTSFAASLAQRVGARLRPVTEADDGGGEPHRHERLSGLQLAQTLAPPGETLLLFDEAEDLFARHSLMFDEPAASSRVFIHRLLEQVTVPVIWTANDIGVLGPAVLRRMTMCVELKVPGPATRARLWRQMGEAEGVALPDGDAGRLARLVPAAPAVASTALRATRLAGGGADTARLIVEGIARAVGGGKLPLPQPELDTAYDPALVNADTDLLALAEGLVRPDAPRAVSFLLSGPPGCGKSAWVRDLAARMGMEVLQKRASDLLDRFVGGTEQNIAGAFAEARDTGAFLVFDEADSLLLDRVDAVRSWEISQVNEMLTWMEQHPLPFACTTNLVGRLDRASLRRFLVKVRFDWLTPEQARLAFSGFFGLAAPLGLDALGMLTPADFALVRRRVALMGEGDDAAALLRLLAAECEGRVGGRVTMGFASGG